MIQKEIAIEEKIVKEIVTRRTLNVGVYAKVVRRFMNKAGSEPLNVTIHEKDSEHKFKLRREVEEYKEKYTEFIALKLDFKFGGQNIVRNLNRYRELRYLKEEMENILDELK